MYEEIITIPNIPGHPFEVDITGISYCDGSYFIERRLSPIHCLEYIVSGTGTVSEDNMTFTASQGDVYLLHRGHHHRYFSDSAEPWVKIWMNVSGPLADELIALYGLDCVCHIPNADGLEAPFREFVENARNLRKHTPDKVPSELLFHSILIKLSALLSNTETGHSGSLASQVKNIIDSAPNYIISLDEIAQKLFCSKSHAIKVFHDTYGITPHEYILQQKTRLAMKLLQSSSISVGSVGEMLGFCDSHYFSGFFKSRVGIPPGRYRKHPEEARLTK